MKRISKSLQDTEKIAKEFVNTVFTKASQKSALVIGLYGDLGSGKTTFSKAVAKTLGIVRHLSSPTFVIQKIYELPPNGRFKKLIHIDAYRLKNGDELASIGWYDVIGNPDNLVLIEWPEQVMSVLPHNHEVIRFTFIDEETREIDF